uniref:Interleukin family protein n=1 Tax=Junco hyemalis TaxID=40217 RepID=A0A8C5JQF2_JUNHY
MRTCSRGTAVPILLLLLLLGTARAQPSCLRFPELLPAKLKELRIKFEEIKDYFVRMAILQQGWEFWSKGGNSGAGMRILEEGWKFWNSQGIGHCPSHIWRRPWKENLSRHCPSHTCDTPGFPLQMKKNGLYKAMGEFDIFINYIERYLTMRRRN